MNPFENVPNEVVVGVCEQMHLEDLARFRATNWKMYNICQDVLISKIIDEMFESELIEFKSPSGGIIQIQGYRKENGKIYLDILQEPLTEIWPFSGIKTSKQKGNIYREAREVPTDESNLHDKIQMLLESGYFYTS